MKKTILTATFLIAGAVGLLAQGIVAFDNNPYSFDDSIENGGAVNYLISTAPGVPVVNASWKVQLYENGVAVGAPIAFYGADFPGVWNTASAAGGDPLDGVRTLNTVKGTTSTLTVAVLDQSGAELVRSTPFAYTSPTSATPAPSDLLMKNFRGFVVPEPSTVALGVLGLGALLLFRRRK